MAETRMIGDRAQSTGAFGPGSGIRQPIDRQIDTFCKALVARKALVAANRDPGAEIPRRAAASDRQKRWHPGGTMWPLFAGHAGDAGGRRVKGGQGAEGWAR